MNPITKLVKYFSNNARKKRALIFRACFQLDENTTILDLGSESGSAIHAVLHNTQVNPKNVYIADIDAKVVEQGAKIYGYNPVAINETGCLDFEDGYFDIVYCSSVIEHVTVPKEEAWKCTSHSLFKDISIKHQKEFATEIMRLGKQYFVQTPYKYFIIESHSWLPFIAWFPRMLLVKTLHVTNRFWVKKTNPDWYLLDKQEMRALFPDAELKYESAFGFVKSLMAVKAKY